MRWISSLFTASCEALCAALGEFHCWRLPEYYYFAGPPSGAMAGRRVVARRGKMASLFFFVNIYARIGDRATPAVDYESACCFLGLLLLIR